MIGTRLILALHNDWERSRITREALAEIAEIPLGNVRDFERGKQSSKTGRNWIIKVVPVSVEAVRARSSRSGE